MYRDYTVYVHCICLKAKRRAEDKPEDFEGVEVRLVLEELGNQDVANETLVTEAHVNEDLVTEDLDSERIAFGLFEEAASDCRSVASVRLVNVEDLDSEDSDFEDSDFEDSDSVDSDSVDSESDFQEPAWNPYSGLQEFALKWMLVVVAQEFQPAKKIRKAVEDLVPAVGDWMLYLFQYHHLASQPLHHHPQAFTECVIHQN